MIWFYRLLYLPGLLLTLPVYISRMWRRGGYGKSFQHRFGRFHRLNPPKAGRIRIWLQAVSVGEVLAIGPLIEVLQKDPRIEIVLTTTTSTGYAEARKRYSAYVLSIGIFPLDFWLFSLTAWLRIRPNAVILTESELWPEHLHQARKRQVPAYLVNARLSDTTFRRYRQVPSLARRLLNKFRGLFAASELDRSRLIDLGCPADQIYTSGSIKFDVRVGERLTGDKKEDLRRSLGFGRTDEPAFVLLGSSTWPGEEAALMEAQRAAIEQGIDCRLLLVPRHAERGRELCAELKTQDRRWYQRSTGTEIADSLSIHLADTTGELAKLTQAADLVFIGKSLAPNEGGQTPIEAAGLGLPILMGPEMNNFKDLARSLIRVGAARQVANKKKLAEAVCELAKDGPARAAMSQAGMNWHETNRGSSARIAERILESLD